MPASMAGRSIKPRWRGKLYYKYSQIKPILHAGIRMWEVLNV